MGETQSKPEECRRKELGKAKQIIQSEGVTGAQILMREKLEESKNVKIKFGVTGMSGAGKSSFINSIRGIEDADELAAEVGIVETTTEPACYTYPDNPKIMFMDLPGIGTPNFPNFKAYCKEVKLETYDMFLILTATRFSNDDLQLAKKIQSMKKSVFLVRTKIDADEDSERRKKKEKFDVKEMEKQIRDDCYKYVKDHGIDEDKIFLICTHKPKQWDFERLVQAILETLSDHQKEALTLSLSVNHLSQYIVKEKVKVLRGQLDTLFKLASFVPLEVLSASPAEAIFLVINLYQEVLTGWDFVPKIEWPHPGEVDKDVRDLEMPNSVLALAVLGKKAERYRSQLGLPEEDSDEFQKMKPEFQERMRKFYWRESSTYLLHCSNSMSKILKNYLSSNSPYEVVKNSLNTLLDEMEKLSLDILLDTATQTKEKINQMD